MTQASEGRRSAEEVTDENDMQIVTDHVCRFLNEVSLADTQGDVADILAAHRELLRSLSIETRAA